MKQRGAPCAESVMQKQVADYFQNRKFWPSDQSEGPIEPTVYREVKIPQVGRISDVIVRITDRRIVNIECKMAAYEEVYRQAKDHLAWADYSYICFFADTYLPAYILDKMISEGIGLLLWQPDMFVEVLQSGYNKKKDKTIRLEVLNKLNQIDKKRIPEVKHPTLSETW